MAKNPIGFYVPGGPFFGHFGVRSRPAKDDSFRPDGLHHSSAVRIRVSRYLRNAYRHAHARSIEAELRYDDDTFVLIVRDDGKGIDPKVLKEHGRAGHWGLRGTYERAEGIGAQLDIWSEAGAGTEARLTVPGAIAYEKSGDGGRFKLFRKKRIYERRS